jgi:hypothetical protein
VVFSELAIKYQLGKLRKGADLVSDGRIEREGFQFVPISAEHGIRSGRLTGRHKDPLDRRLAAQAQSENGAIISSEAVWVAYGVRRFRQQSLRLSACKAKTRRRKPAQHNASKIALPKMVDGDTQRDEHIRAGITDHRGAGNGYIREGREL